MAGTTIVGEEKKLFFPNLCKFERLYGRREIFFTIEISMDLKIESSSLQRNLEN